MHPVSQGLRHRFTPSEGRIQTTTPSIREQDFRPADPRTRVMNQGTPPTGCRARIPGIPVGSRGPPRNHGATAVLRPRTRSKVERHGSTIPSWWFPPANPECGWCDHHRHRRECRRCRHHSSRRCGSRPGARGLGLIAPTGPASVGEPEGEEIGIPHSEGESDRSSRVRSEIGIARPPGGLRVGCASRR